MPLPTRKYIQDLPYFTYNIPDFIQLQWINAPGSAFTIDTTLCNSLSKFKMFTVTLYCIISCFILSNAASLGGNFANVRDSSKATDKEIRDEIILRYLSLLLEERNDQPVRQVTESISYQTVSDGCDSTFKIGTFNIQVLGVTKMSLPEVVNVVIKILKRYDLVLIQEIRDKSQEAIVDLFDYLNAETNDAYSMEISDRLGRTSSKEQYAFFYRSESFQVVDSYLYNDVGDRFEREPFIVRFSLTDPAETSDGIKEFVFAGIHVKPQDAKNEIDHLADVYDDMVSRWGLKDVIIGGDFNADCSYLSNSAWKEIRLWTEARFKWLFGNKIDSTVTFSNCAYDRLVIAGSILSASILPSSPTVFHFDQTFALSHDEAEDVSDHYPIEILLSACPVPLMDITTEPAITISADCNVFKVAAFNIQVFGITKMANPEVADILIQILERYDLVLIQEIRDESETAIVDLLAALNAETNDAYSMEISDRLGRTSSKEQYAFFYRYESFQVVDSYHYDDVGDLFEREPFIVRFSLTDPFETSNGLKEFAFVGIHVKPDDAQAEIDLLANVYDDVVSRWNLQDVIIGGDFNADCSYLPYSAWEEIRLWTEDRFKWLFRNDIDSTVGLTECAYDRLILAGSILPTSIVPSSPAVFHFDQKFALSPEEAEDVSDHYPIEVSLFTCPSDY